MKRDLALLWKEWRQLRALRWSGVGIGLALPLFMVIGAEAGKAGLSPFGGVSSYSSHQLIVDAAPLLLALGVWPLMALLAGANAIAGDRAAGTENFLIERPLTRTRIHLARVLASIGTTVAIALGTLVPWAMIVQLLGGPQPSGWRELLSMMAVAGTVSCSFALLGAWLAATLVDAPILAALLGAIFGVLPVALAVPLIRFFPLAVYPRMLLPFERVPFPATPVTVSGIALHAATLVPLTLVPAFLFASWWASSRGEPAGGSRRRRAGFITIGAPLTALALFFGIAPLGNKVDAAMLSGVVRLDPAPEGGMAIASAGRYELTWAAMIDTTTCRRVATLRPPIEDWQWSPDGKVVALHRSDGPFGSIREPRIEFLDRSGNQAMPAWRLPAADADLSITGLVWAHDRLVVRVLIAEERTKFYVVEPGTGATRTLSVPNWSFLLGADQDGGALIVTKGRSPYRTDGTGVMRNTGDVSKADIEAWLASGEVRRIDLATGELTDRVLARKSLGESSASGLIGGLSPSGRFLAKTIYDSHRRIAGVTDLVTGESREFPWGAVWMKNDTLVWVETAGARRRLMVWAVGEPGKEPREVRGWEGAQLRLIKSPDDGSLLVRVGDFRADPRTGMTADGKDQGTPPQTSGTTPNGTNGTAPGSPQPPSPVTPDGKDQSAPPPIQETNPGRPGVIVMREEWVFRIADESWTPIPVWSKAQEVAAFSRESGYWGYAFEREAYGRGWAGPDTLYRRGPGLLAFEDVEAPGKLRYYRGRSPSLD